MVTNPQGLFVTAARRQSQLKPDQTAASLSYRTMRRIAHPGRTAAKLAHAHVRNSIGRHAYRDGETTFALTQEAVWTRAAKPPDAELTTRAGSGLEIGMVC